MQIFLQISVTRLQLCSVIIYLSDCPTNPLPYVREKCRHPPSSVFIVPSSLRFCNGVFPKVSGYVPSSRFGLINLCSLAASTITSTPRADTVRYADEIRNAAVLYTDTSEFARFFNLQRSGPNLASIYHSVVCNLHQKSPSSR